MHAVAGLGIYVGSGIGWFGWCPCPNNGNPLEQILEARAENILIVTEKSRSRKKGYKRRSRIYLFLRHWRRDEPPDRRVVVVAFC